MADVIYKIGNSELTPNKVKTVQLTAGGSTHTYNMTLVALWYHKKIFEPCMVHATILLRESATEATPKLPSAQTLGNHFADAAVSLKVTHDGTNDTSIASDYYVYRVEPEYMRDGAGAYARVSLFCYSRDHKLTVEPYCRMYVNKKLIGKQLTETPSYTTAADSTVTCKITESLNTDTADDGIIRSELGTNGVLTTAGFTFKNDSSDNIDCTNLQTLKYISKKITTEPGTGKTLVNTLTLKNEFIQPYLVQYNESFYDFIARTANRCGEFVYHEGGKWHIGLKETEAEELSMSNVLSYRSCGYGAELISPTPTSNNSMDVERKDSKSNTWGQLTAGSTGTYFYYDELPVDEYLGMTLEKNKFASFSDEFTFDNWIYFVVDTANTLLSEASLIKAMASLTIGAAKSALHALNAENYKNLNGYEIWIKGANAEMKDGDKVSLYGSRLSNTSQHYNYAHNQNLNAKFYQFISKCCKGVSKSLIEVDVDTMHKRFGLCDIVTFDGSDCLVIEVSEDLLTESGDRSAALQGQHLVLAPKFSASVYSFTSTDSNTKEDLYTTESKLLFFCPPAVVPFIRTAGPQRAFVSENQDPEGYGRVCIKYPWQPVKEEASPWIRVAVPFAPSDSPDDVAGMLFEPSRGDEVLVDYEYGNIEHPVVVGSLYTRRTKAPKTRKPLLSGEDMPVIEKGKDGKERLVYPIKERRITSSKGHSLIFNDGDSVSEFVAGILPALGFIKRFASLVGGAPLDFGSNDNFTGGITLTDKWGLYKIAASSTERSITIQSPFGDVNLSAFSGITIDAPNGNIAITGKNVNIEAGNNLSIVSGKNIADKEKAGEENGADVLAGVLTGILDEIVAPIADISLLRTVIEALVKPVAGTLTLQSGRYMLLTAGKGKVDIPDVGFADRGKHISSTFEERERDRLMRTAISMPIVVDTWLTGLNRLYTEVKNAKTDLTNSLGGCTITTPNQAELLNCPNNLINRKPYKKKDIVTSTRLGDLDQRRVLRSINTLQARVKACVKYCKDIQKGSGFHYVTQCRSEVKKALKDMDMPDVVMTTFREILTYNDHYDKDPATIDTDDNKKIMRRVLMHRVNENMKLTQDTSRALVRFANENDYKTDLTWQNYVNNLKEEERSKLSNTFLGKITDTLPIKGWNTYNDRNAWSGSQEGELLFSDDDQETLSIDATGAFHSTQNKSFTDKLQDVLKGATW